MTTVTGHWAVRHDYVDGRIEILSDDYDDDPTWGPARAAETWRRSYPGIDGAVPVHQTFTRGDWREPTTDELTNPPKWPHAEWSPDFPNGVRVAGTHDAATRFGVDALVIRDVTASAWVEVAL